MPLYQLLGGKSRTSVMVYGHANGSDIKHAVEVILKYRELGYQAIWAQSGVPGLDKVYGVGGGIMFYEPADAALASEQDWSTEKYLGHTPRCSTRCVRRLDPTSIFCMTCTTGLLRSKRRARERIWSRSGCSGSRMGRRQRTRRRSG